MSNVITMLWQLVGLSWFFENYHKSVSSIPLALFLTFYLQRSWIIILSQIQLFFCRYILRRRPPSQPRQRASFRGAARFLFSQHCQFPLSIMLILKKLCWRRSSALVFLIRIWHPSRFCRNLLCLCDPVYFIYFFCRFVQCFLKEMKTSFANTNRFF